MKKGARKNRALRAAGNRASGCRTAGCVSVILLLLAALPAPATAQDKYPVKPINLLVGFAPGGSSDIVSRALAPAAGAALGQPVVVANRPGGGSVVMVSSLKNAEPDGYTLGNIFTGPIAAQYMRDDVPYVIRKDFTPIMGFAESQYGLVVKSESPFKTLKDIVIYARNNPGKITYGTAGLGGPQHLVMERIAEKEKIVWKNVPFSGAMPAITALLGGHVEASSNSSEWKKFVEAGKLRLLAVYGEKRNPDFPDVPTLIELGYNITAPTVCGLIGPKGMNPKTVEKIHDGFKKAMDEKEYSEIVARAGMIVKYRNTADFTSFLMDLDAQMGKIISALGIKEKGKN